MKYGLNIELEKQHQSPEDWLFSSASKRCLAQIPENQREKCLPIGEIQIGKEDMMDCATRAPINILETKFYWLTMLNDYLSPDNKKWLRDNFWRQGVGIAFSDAFVAVNSGTTPQGNSLKAPLDAIRKQGVVPKHLLPLEPYMTWAEYHDPNRITSKMKSIGEEFAERFTINYERVFKADFPILLPRDILVVAGYAWPEPIKDEYPRVDFSPNHAFIIYLNQYRAFDNYLDTDGDFIKKLARDYNFFDYGYRLSISENPKKRSWFFDYLKDIFR